MYIIFCVFWKKNEKAVYQKIPCYSPGQDYENSCCPNGKASEYSHQAILTIFYRTTS